MFTLASFRVVMAQNNAPSEDADHQNRVSTWPSSTDAKPSGGSLKQKATPTSESSTLVISSGDEVEVTVYGAPDLSKHARVSADGNISMPLIGYVKVAGLNSSEAEGAIGNEFRRHHVLNDPQVSVYVKEYTGSGISVTGEVAKPGVYSAVGPHRLFDILQSAGGLTDKAADAITISHRGSDNPIRVELPKDPGELSRVNVELLPGDTVVVPAAPIVYVLGEVTKPGGYVLNSKTGVTLLRVVAAAGGPTHDASVGDTKMLRTTPSGLNQLQVPLKNIMQAKAPDMPVQAEDIIYVPRSRIKAALSPGMLLNTVASVAIYRVPF
jgi:polysaccharide export outer membrane protein